MVNNSDSIEQLTASLQELTAHRQEEHGAAETPLSKALSANDLSFSEEVEAFVQRNRDYAIQTRAISVGTY